MYETLKTAFSRLIEKENLWEFEVEITTKVLTPKEAIGEPERVDFPLLQGKEFLIQASFMNAFGQAFTDSPMTFRGKISDILSLTLLNNAERAIFIASLNVVMRYTGMVESTVHCRDKGPELCAQQMVRAIIDRYGSDINIGIVGFQPAIIDHFVMSLTNQNVRIIDLDYENINKIKYGVLIWDGRQRTEELFKTSDVVLATGSTIVNNTLPLLLTLAKRFHRELYVYGTTIAGPGKILDLNRLCFMSS